MLTIERTEDWVIVKLPPTVTDEELRALEESYGNILAKIKESAEVEEDDSEVDGHIVSAEILELSREARKGAWESLKEKFKDSREFDAVIAAMEEE